MSASQEPRPSGPVRSARNAAPPAGAPFEAIRFGNAGRMPDAASALGTTVAELVAAAAGCGRGDVTVQVLPPDRGRRGRVTVITVARPDDDAGPRLGQGHDLLLAKALIAQAGGELDRFVSGTGAGWCVRL